MRCKFYVFVLYCSTLFSGRFCDQVIYYRNLINKQINESLNYIYDTDASSYRPYGEEEIDIGTFDFIIVGAGSTGSVIANRLSEVTNWKILLLEAGKDSNDITDIPNMAKTVRLSDYNWGYKSVPQKTACLDMPHRKCILQRGRGIGGTTLLNGLVYCRGNKNDYDNLERRGNPGWSYDEVLPYFIKSEDFNENDPDVTVDWCYHGEDGPLRVEYPVPGDPLTKFWVAANLEKGYKVVDYNGENQMGAAVIQLNIKKGKRYDGGNAFIKPIISRPNLTVLTNSYVIKVLISRRTVTGVLFVRSGFTYKAKARKEVILSAGVVGSPQILMLSRIGPSEHLKKVGIRPIVNLPVGNTLQDQPAIPLIFSCNFTEPIKPLDEYIREYLDGRGPLTSLSYVEGLGFYRSKFGEENYPDLELIFAPFDPFAKTLDQQLSKAREKFFLHLKGGSFEVIVTALHVKSSGTFRLKTNDPFDYSLIDFKLLSDTESRDIDTLYEGIKLTLDLLSSQTFAQINAKLVKQEVPACEQEVYLSKKYWYCILRYFTVNACHAVGTCPMGPNASYSVVNSNAEVYGVRHLRVADASILPFTFSGHPNAACVMVGEKVSDLIKSKYL